MFKEIYNNTQSELWLTFFIIIFIIIIKKSKEMKKVKLPPGPVGLPIVGYLPFMTKYPHLKFTELTKKYGNVFSIYVGSKLCIVFNGAETIREAYNKEEFLGRPPNISISECNPHDPFFCNDIQIWHEHRRFFMQSMKQIGAFNSKLENHIEEEIRYFLNVLGESNGQPIDPIKYLTPSIANNISALAFGERYEYTNRGRMLVDRAVEDALNIAEKAAIFTIFPWLNKLPFVSRIYKNKEKRDVYQAAMNFIKAKVEMHKKTLDAEDKRDFVDCYLNEINSRTGKYQKSSFSENYLYGALSNLLGSGSETVRSLMSWCIYTMAAYPEVQRRSRQEIDAAIGMNRFPQCNDQKNLHYTQAVIREILRWKTITPLSIFRYTLNTTEVGGYTIPKGTIVTANMHSVHHDISYWKDPENFRPERFLTSDETLLKTNHFIPFSVGKRSCPGENMAMMEAFLYFVALLQKFDITFPEGYKPTFEAELGITYRLKPHKICFKPLC